MSSKNKQQLITTDKLPLRMVKLVQKLLLKGEKRADLIALVFKITEEVEPQTEIENIFCEKIISLTWKLQRAMEIERNLLNRQNEITLDERNDYFDGRKRIRNIKKIYISQPAIQDIIRYQTELEKTLQKTIGRLREEQKIRENNSAISKSAKKD